MTSALNLLGLEDNVNMNSNKNKVMTLADARVVLEREGLCDETSDYR
jgi:hypothetical protein